MSQIIQRLPPHLDHINFDRPIDEIKNELVQHYGSDEKLNEDLQSAQSTLNETIQSLRKKIETPLHDDVEKLRLVFIYLYENSSEFPKDNPVYKDSLKNFLMTIKLLDGNSIIANELSKIDQRRNDYLTRCENLYNNEEIILRYLHKNKKLSAGSEGVFSGTISGKHMNPNNQRLIGPYRVNNFLWKTILFLCRITNQKRI